MSYKYPILMAIFFFPFVALLLILPFLIYHYRKYGSMSIIKGVILYSFVFYLLCAYFLVILPLPSFEEVAHSTREYYNLKPFSIVNEVLTNGSFDIKNINTYHFLLNDFSFLEPLFNIFLLIPFGAYLRYYFKVPFLYTVFFSLCLSFFFEFTQLTGLYFIYPRPYRLCDVNDLVNNTLGGLIGYLIAPLFFFFLPSKEEMDYKDNIKSKKVTLIRKLVSLIIDYFIIISFSLILSLKFDFFITYIINTFLMFVLIPYITRGYTFGKWLIYIRIIDNRIDGYISFIKLIIRWLILHIFIINGLYIINKFYTLNKYTIILYIFLSLILCILPKKNTLKYTSVFGIEEENDNEI